SVYSSALHLSIIYIFLFIPRPPPLSTLFPYTTLFRSVLVRPSYVIGGRAMEIVYNENELRTYMESAVKASKAHPILVDKYLSHADRKSTRLNSSHVSISYAVFCLKKKKKTIWE